MQMKGKCIEFKLYQLIVVHFKIAFLFTKKFADLEEKNFRKQLKYQMQNLFMPMDLLEVLGALKAVLKLPKILC